jgi:hypothetical protein
LRIGSRSMAMRLATAAAQVSKELERQ